VNESRTIPSLDDITARWLGERLEAHGYDNVRIDGFEAMPIGTGQLARTIRFSLQLRDADDSVPRSVVGKFPSEDPTSRATASGGLYSNEVGFYKDLKPLVSIRTPECYHAEIDDAGAEFVLLLEDLSPAEPGDQIAGCDSTIARAGVLELAGLHAPTWNQSEHSHLSWLSKGTGAEQIGHIHQLFQQCLPGFLNSYQAQLDAAIVEIFEQVASATNYASQFAQSNAACLTHCDYRLDNLLIRKGSAPVTLYAVDWQTVAPGNPLSDVALFVGGSLQPDERNANEQQIVRDYHGKLIELGVADYDWQRCWTDYRLSAFSGFMTAVCASMMTERTDRGDKLFTTMAHRHARHARDLDAQALLS